MLTMFTYALGGVDLDIMLGSSNPEASIVLSLLYQFAMGTVLMSLLTGKQIVARPAVISMSVHNSCKNYAAELLHQLLHKSGIKWACLLLYTCPTADAMLLRAWCSHAMASL
jgi:hypothetical protein